MEVSLTPIKDLGVEVSLIPQKLSQVLLILCELDKCKVLKTLDSAWT